jgi:hypothetical protein
VFETWAKKRPERRIYQRVPGLTALEKGVDAKRDKKVRTPSSNLACGRSRAALLSSAVGPWRGILRRIGGLIAV